MQQFVLSSDTKMRKFPYNAGVNHSPLCKPAQQGYNAGSGKGTPRWF